MPLSEPSLRSSDTEFELKLVTATSMPGCASKAPAAIPAGLLPTAGVCAPGTKVPSPVPNRTERLFEPELTTTRSRTASPFSLPVQSAPGPLPTLIGGLIGAGSNVPLPLLSRTDTPSPTRLAIARSGPSSPSKSPATTAAAPNPPNTSLVVKLPGAAPA